MRRSPTTAVMLPFCTTCDARTDGTLGVGRTVGFGSPPEAVERDFGPAARQEFVEGPPFFLHHRDLGVRVLVAEGGVGWVEADTPPPARGGDPAPHLSRGCSPRRRAIS